MTKHLVYVEAKAQKQLKKLPRNDRERIIAVLNVLENSGFSARIDIKKLQGFQGHYRIRLGSYRIRFELSSDQSIIVYSISQREKAYE